MTNYLTLSIEEINKLLINKKIKPIDLVNEAFEKIEKSDLNAFITLNKEEAVKLAKELENQPVDNLFFGIPIAIKDNIVTKGLLTTAASKMLADFNPPYDATVIKKIKKAKMIIIGKTNMDEFAMGSTGETSYYGPTLNPYNKSKIPGGSSSGSAVAVSANLVPLAIGSDTGGSVRQPSALTGIVGMKPTYGRVSRYGLIAFASSLDQIGPMTKTVTENAQLLNLISGKDTKDLNSINTNDDFTKKIGCDIKGMKIAIPDFYMGDVTAPVIKEKILEIIEFLKNNGVVVESVKIPFIEHSIHLYQVIALGEASSNLARFDGIRYGYLSDNYNDLNGLYENTRSEGFGDEVKRRIMIGSYILSSENADKYYYRALKIRNLIKKSFENIFNNYDLIIGPTTTDVAYDLGLFQNDTIKGFYDDIFVTPVNLAGLPALSLPVGKSLDNLPIGLQIISKAMGEVTIYQLASYIEQNFNGGK